MLHARGSLEEVKAALMAEVGRLEASIRTLRKKLARLAPTEAGGLQPRARSRDGWTQAKREEVSRRMRAFWAARRREDDAPHGGEGASR